MVFENLCVFVLWTNVALALEVEIENNTTISQVQRGGGGGGRTRFVYFAKEGGLF